jgi:hypothetical protein
MFAHQISTAGKTFNMMRTDASYKFSIKIMQIKVLYLSKSIWCYVKITLKSSKEYFKQDKIFQSTNLNIGKCA